MDELRHLFPKKTAKSEKYVYGPPVRGGPIKLPLRDDRVEHGSKLIGEVKVAEHSAAAASADQPKERHPAGIVLDFCSDPGFKLQLQSLDIRQSGIELRNSRTVGDMMHATVFVPKGKLGVFVRKFEKYTKEDDKRSGKPKNKTLVESINTVRLASLKSFWTDTGTFPATEKPIWWEVWLREASNPHDVTDQFGERAQAVGIEVRDREIRFPERRVLLARATVEQLMAVENLFDILAELRLAKHLPGEFLQLPPREQGVLLEKTRSRVQPPPENAPSVCHLDTGVNRGHPLLECALREEHVLAVDPAWTPADLQGHGTEMAGLALYGCLTSVLGTEDPIVLRHNLESVKILPDFSENDPDLYGDITSQAASRIEIAARGRVQRAFCLTITADGRDEGLPSSWSGALDQTCAGVGEEDSPKRLVIVSAGNLALDVRHEYPNRNHLEGIEDPAQAWNVLTVGAYTERATYQLPDYDNWQPIAEPGHLSPGSRTSCVWVDKSWPMKPEIVMEGGNNAIDPSTKRADFVDDLSLLTTRLTPDGALLTTTGDTSAATALAARYAAIIWARYAGLWPETVRALLVHSARWTLGMLEEFPGKTQTDRESRLRCYGYGVPDLQKAIWSVGNAATLVIEASLQPFEKEKGKAPGTKDMHIHRLPWPTSVLRELGEIDVRMRITLSYFIEPSPGKRGWTRKHRYQSHGLRFDVRRPDETVERFRKRISKAARDEEEEQVAFGSDDRTWEIGDRLRRKGSVHSDTWTGSAAELADCGVIAVFPVTGWWKERPHLECWNRRARYALIVTIETPQTDVDLYTPIANLIGIPIETPIDT